MAVFGIRSYTAEVTLMGVMVVSSVTTYGQTRRPGDKYYNMNVLEFQVKVMLGNCWSLTKSYEVGRPDKRVE